MDVFQVTFQKKAAILTKALHNYLLLF